MSKYIDDNQVKDYLVQLKCHFTWELAIEEAEIPDLESRVLEEIEFLDTKYSVGIHNLLAYVEHLKGQNDKALQSLKDAESLIQREHTDQSDMRSLVTWGNYAWVYYHVGRLADAKMYLDKVQKVCKKFSSPFYYRMECPELDCEEGWALLKCGRKNYERAQACFQNALEMEPENPEFNTGYAITTYRLDYFNTVYKNGEAPSLDSLKKAVRLNPEDTYIKVLLALKLQDMGQQTEGEKYVEEALSHKSSQTYIFRYAAIFYRKASCVDKALELLQEALQAIPDSAFLNHQVGLCYRAKVMQIKKATNMQPRGQDREDMDEYIRLAIFYLKFALKQKPVFDIALLHLALMYIEAGKYREAEDTFQKLLSMTPHEKSILQRGHFSYGKFHEYQRRSDTDAIRHYLKATQIGELSFITDKSINSLEKLALRKLQRNAFDTEGLSLLEYVHKLKGKRNEALEYSEEALSLAPHSEEAGGSDP
ncbi:PREDICTED: interferon-induced protein with tetratricopeptide repeats 1 [Chinchilla lanigera]|uniref:Interferon-induced protein with tetratricopeptide repeats 1 n=1 Tax=Chinchilla lanigera TaxID=34839 RepID=A0A8C2YPC5_CHILA|nr:PREDICTED: interferon-induced protein with tetratricopeptide repeats 1 [Chinchilla lanigera]